MSSAEPTPGQAPACGSLAGRIAVVTGGLTGIGAATAQRLAAAGAGVYAAGLVPGETPGDAPEAEAHGEGWIRRAAADVTNRLQVRELLAGISAEHGGIDIVVNCAGVIAPTPVFDTSPTAVEKLVGVNLVGAINVILEAATAMKDRGGVIAAVTSTQAVLAESGSSVYAATKAGLGHFLASVVPELAGTGIRVVGVAVGATRTPMTAASHSPDTEEGRRRAEALDRFSTGPFGEFWMDPAETARTIAFLVSDEARGVHGTTVVVDQGMTSAHRLPAAGPPA